MTRVARAGFQGELFQILRLSERTAGQGTGEPVGANRGRTRGLAGPAGGREEVDFLGRLLSFNGAVSTPQSVFSPTVTVGF